MSVFLFGVIQALCNAERGGGIVETDAVCDIGWLERVFLEMLR